MAAYSGRPAPLKPWERPEARGGSSAGSPFAPTTSTSTTASVISSGVVSSGEKKDEVSAVRDVSVADGRQLPIRPWERSNTGYGSTTAGYGSTSYNRPYGSLGYNGYGGTYGADYRGSYLGNSYGSSYGGMYGGSPYGGYGGGLNNRYGGYGGMGGYNMGGPMVPYGGYGPGDPNNRDGGSPPRPASFWESVLRAMHGVVNFFGRISILVDENTQAIHFFITALLQLCDRAGVLYGELARFVLRLLGFRTRARERSKAASRALLGSGTKLGNDSQGMPKGDGTWDNVWSDNNSNEPKQ
ncbi:hypothetical protein O6H91_01G041300 [Diphasiastrum complanatum]|uniref:Uncharacterized protein n=1 Tax=Diphasiastrum complanatum TaxID=34168 RepID=A0ACC2EQ70_DIPCM|nr:hypothetical protein O6H91_Y085800 [Diphasiastrum complanatum]KAJ7568627.1 hypothetical protein O6H91_01G041300 [Diphasiastrum complanatum]